MRIFRKLTFWLAVLVCGISWAWFLDRLISFGPVNSHSYSRAEYDENKLCDMVKSGMEIKQVMSLVSSLGKPNEIEYQRAEEQDIESVRRMLRSHGRPDERLVPSDLAGPVGDPNTVVYLNNILRVGGRHGLCDVQMDTTGNKVINVTRSGSGGIE